MRVRRYPQYGFEARFPLNVCTNEGLVSGMQPCYFHVNVEPPPPPKKPTKICVMSMNMTKTSLKRIPIHSVKAMKPCCIMAEDKPQWIARAWRLRACGPGSITFIQFTRERACDCTSQGNSNYPNQLNLTIRVARQRLSGWHHHPCLPKKNYLQI